MLFRNWKFSKKMAISFQVLSVFICFPVVFHSMLLVHLLLLCSLRFVGPSALLATGCYCCFFYNCLCFLLKLMNPYGFLIKIRFDQYLSPAQPAPRPCFATCFWHLCSIFYAGFLINDTHKLVHLLPLSWPSAMLRYQLLTFLSDFLAFLYQFLIHVTYPLELIRCSSL